MVEGGMLDIMEEGKSEGKGEGRGKVGRDKWGFERGGIGLASSSSSPAIPLI